MRTAIFAAVLMLALAFFTVSTVHADVLTRQLDLGMSGSDVGSLQTFLAKDATLYPQGLITNYFGSLTKSAVSNFQARNGIATVGRVGPVTLAALNLQMSGMTSTTGSNYAPIITNVAVTNSSNSANVQWNTNEVAGGIVYYSTSYPSMSEANNDVTISGAVAMTDVSLHMSQNVYISGLQSNTTYYYEIYTKDASGNVQMTWPATFKTQ